MNHHAVRYDGVLGQITETFSAGHHIHAVQEKWHRNMGFCRAAVISPLNCDAMVVAVAGGGVVAALGEVPAGMTEALRTCFVYHTRRRNWLVAGLHR